MKGRFAEDPSGSIVSEAENGALPAVGPFLKAELLSASANVPQGQEGPQNSGSPDFCPLFFIHHLWDK